ncbi:DUF4255 domain-containing protein [Streptomyces calidiresistens]|uniref:DUF4255 domain-containing protein n=1 Tax=Streptomyces calidiresistens TaxID=1485586 RepID=A0A7W3T8C5_9ACTN|nr:Pvc16 family protein [Streptomyces calidiresistens]MBB0232663.1 DUF4255 domain-containing protein [Streptomyces calidiresistens]
MIHEVDETLRRLLNGGALAGSGVEVSFDMPNRDWSARLNGPVINVYLYDIREDTGRRRQGEIPVHDGDRRIVKYREAPRWLRLSYLVTAWTKQAVDEHRLLSAVLATLLPRESIPPHELHGSLAELGLVVGMRVVGPVGDSRSSAEIWPAIGGELKPSVEVVVTAPFPVYPEYDAAPLVTRGATVRIRDGVHGDGTSSGIERSHGPEVVKAEAARRRPDTPTVG